MRRYELMLLLRPDLDDERLQAAVERVTRAIVNAGGSLSKVSPWGKRRLAYEIAHQREASYFLIHFEIDPAAVRGIERALLISEEILRHMVTILEDRPTGRPDSDGRPGRPATPPAAEAAAGELAPGPEDAASGSEEEPMDEIPGAEADLDEDVEEADHAISAVTDDDAGPASRAEG